MLKFFSKKKKEPERIINPVYRRVVFDSPKETHQKGIDALKEEFLELVDEFPELLSEIESSFKNV